MCTVLVAALGLLPVLAFAICWLVRMPFALQEMRACMSLPMAMSEPVGYLNAGLLLQLLAACCRMYNETPQRQERHNSAPVLFCMCVLHVQVPALSACFAKCMLTVQEATAPT